ncbi:hypothetical protein SAMN05216303_101593 [Rhodoferax sp. OV413]|nr:hypothetical protein SAMN05216303_101593 [Rhodoferax sp. OV413]
MFIQQGVKNVVCNPLSGGSGVQNIPHRPAYPAGSAVYITLGFMSPHTDNPAPASEARTCERCGCELPSADAVCAKCDSELSARAKGPQFLGKHNCPSCQLAFSKPAFVLTPAGAKWYVPQVQRLACPHCNAFLLDTRNPRLSSSQIFALLFLVVCAQFLLPAPYALPGRIAIAFALLALYVYRRSWGVPDSRRYIRDEA